ncbi:MAG: hypothetical protein COB69_03995 [Phycisphaera sp.]|nr:MAG: hypothetical protein COB69_03995 [Phycisphaera sp.]
MVLAGAGVVYFMTTGTPGTQSKHPLDMESQWICLAENEPHDFILTIREISQFPDGVTCTVCSSAEVSRAFPCTNCDRHYPIGRYNASPANCMHCGFRLDGADISVFHGSEGH